MSQSRSKSKSSSSPSSKGKRSSSKSSDRKHSKQRSKSHSNNKRKRSSSYQRRRSPPKRFRRNAESIPKSSKLFIANINASLNSQQVKANLEKQFGKFGQIKQVNIRTKKGSQNSYAFVQFKNQDDAEDALKQMNNKQFMGKQIKVQFGKGQRKQQDRRRDKCYICHKQGHFAQDCRYKDRQNDRYGSRDHGKRRKYSRSSSSDRSHRRKRSHERQKHRDYRHRDDRSRDRRRSPDRRKQSRYERRQRY